MDDGYDFERERRRMLDDVCRAWDHCDCDDRGRPLTAAEYEHWRGLWQGAPASSEDLLRVCGGSWSSVLRLSGVVWMPIVVTLQTPPQDDGDWHQHVVVADADGQRHYRDGHVVVDLNTREEHIELLATALDDQPDLVWLSYAYWLESHGYSAELAATLYLHFTSWQQAVKAARELGAQQSREQARATLQESVAGAGAASRSRAICRSRAAIEGTSHQSSRREPRSAS